MQYLLIAYSFLFYFYALGAVSWEDLLQEYRYAMGDDTYHLLHQQYQAYSAGQAPAIASTCIKDIPINECGEELIDLYTTNHARIKVMTEDELPLAHQSPDDIDPRSEKHGMMRKGVFEALMRMIQELDLLAPLFGYEAGDLEMRLFEGLRDLTTQQVLFDTKMASIMLKNPEMTHDQAYAETSKWVSPYKNNVPVHSTGGAIDIALWHNKQQVFCDMGRFNVGGGLAPTFTQDSTLNLQQAKNRLLFLTVATRAGLTNYVYEFWHFSYGDRYAIYWREADHGKRISYYSAV